MCCYWKVGGSKGSTHKIGADFLLCLGSRDFHSSRQFLAGLLEASPSVSSGGPGSGQGEIVPTSSVFSAVCSGSLGVLQVSTSPKKPGCVSKIHQTIALGGSK